MTVIAALGVTKRYAGTTAIAGADLEVGAGEIVGICGPSGSGKSTLLRMLAAIEAPTTGSVLLGGAPAWRSRARRRVRRPPRPGFVMPVFQDPVASLDPRWPVWRSVTEPLCARVGGRRRPSRGERRAIAAGMLARVGLDHVSPEAHPAELSVGQCQRASILRAMAGEPAAIVADEPTSALDVTSAAGVLHLLRGLADEGTALVVVSHDEAMLAVLADRVLRMRDGRLGSDRGSPPFVATGRHTR
jgi:ABC-type glutathione transport system ATPase component